MQEYIEAHTKLEDLEGDVVVIIAFDYEHEAVIEAIHDVQHQLQDVITTTKVSGVSRRSSAVGPPHVSATSRTACAISMR
jgi:metal-responsive CopG/Arc/MetJ family transcriptional regulator